MRGVKPPDRKCPLDDVSLPPPPRVQEKLLADHLPRIGSDSSFNSHISDKSDHGLCLGDCGYHCRFCFSVMVMTYEV